jgi:hypothetical protein
MTQLSIDFTPRQRGADAAEACTAKAEGLGFSTVAARAFVLAYLADQGPAWGEDVVDAAIATGCADLTAHDGRAWGSVFSTLSRLHQIHCLRADGIRRHGRGTSGARQWGRVQ